MTRDEAQRFLAIYFLASAGIIGVYAILFGETPLLPVPADDAKSAFKIIVPVFLGQVAVMYQWFATRSSQTANEKIDIPAWAIRLPPLMSLLIVVLTVVILVLGAKGWLSWRLPSTAFLDALTFAVSILNASTILLVARLFPRRR